MQPACAKGRQRAPSIALRETLGPKIENLPTVLSLLAMWRGREGEEEGEAEARRSSISAALRSVFSPEARGPAPPHYHRLSDRLFFLVRGRLAELLAVEE